MRPQILSLLVLAVGCSNTEPAPTPETPDSDASRVSCNVRVPEDAGSLQEAVDRVRDGGTICLGEGVFDGTLKLHDRDLSINGMGMGRTILQGDGLESALYVMGSDVELRGVTITGGVADQGGGIHVHDSDLRLEGVEVTGNTAHMDGGGIYASHSVVTVDDVWVTGNTAAMGGGGIFVGQAELYGDDLVIHENTAAWGGGLKAGLAGVWLTDSFITGNSAVGADANGGGVYLHNVEAAFENVVVGANHSDWRGGGLTVGGGTSHTFTNLTILKNHAQEGAAVHVHGWGYVAEFTNTVVAWNKADVGGTVIVNEGGMVDFTYSDFWKNSDPLLVSADEQWIDPEMGNINVAPRFASIRGDDPSRWDLRVHPESPLHDAGDPSMTDADGSVSDIGFYASQDTN